MMIIPGYEIIGKIAESRQAVIYRAYHKKDPERLLALKVFKSIFLSDSMKSQFRQRIEHLRVLGDPLIITPIAFEAKDGACFLSQDYFDGTSLSRLAGARSGISLNAFFSLSCLLAQALGKVHEAGIIHGAIKASNILVNPSTLDIRLIDFISALDVRDVSHFIHDPSFIRETLAYTSPEQTGRINHRVAFSSDLYCLGVIFHELLTGRLPFFSDDPLELIHSHLAEEAPKVHELNPAIPVAVSAIVAKLLQKEPERRYQSSSGLLADLVRCRDEYAATGKISEFQLESGAYTQRVAFVSRMVGRGKEAAVILDEYEQVARGEFRSLFISGSPGIGKTRLIQELHKPIVRHRGYFTFGKYDVYQKNIPYSSLVQAFRNLVRTFLTESDERVALWKERIQSAVGSNGKVLTEVIPELEVLIGLQPDVRELPPVESLSRFHDVFDRFLTALATAENPLTLFVDDLQWCDTASFDFLSNVFANYQDHPYLFLLGAYRSSEVDQSHPLSRLIESAGRERQPLKEIRLEPLKPEHCHEMVSYILDSPLPQTRALSEFLSALSEGNPLFVSESLSFFHDEELLSIDEERQWRWDLDKIRQSPMPTSVVALFSSKIDRLAPDLISMLEYCACMGNVFSPAELSLVRETTLLQVFETLQPALEQGLLIESGSQLHFIHDRVQEAALSSIPKERRRLIHRQIGSRLLAAVPEGAAIEKVENLFTIASHLNLGREELPSPESTHFLSDLNYQAGKKALSALATESANEYFKLSLELLPESCWEEEHYERTFRKFQKAAKTELMCGNYEGSERLLNMLLDHARSDLDRVECLAEQTTSLSSVGSFIKAIETANRGLAYFGKAIPQNPDEVDKRRQELMDEIASKGIDIRETILNMAFATDRKSRVEHAFYSDLLADLYLSGRIPELYLVAAQAILHCLSAGMDQSVIYAFTAMAIYLAEHEEFEQSFIYEDLTRDLAAKYPNTFAATKCMTGRVFTLMHSRSRPEEIVVYSHRAIQCGKNCGDLNNAGYSYGPLMWSLQVQGRDFFTIEDHIKECLQFSNRYHLSIAAGLAEAMQAGWVAPMKKGFAPIPMEEKIASWEQRIHTAPAGSYFVHMALAHYYFGEHEEAARHLERAERYLAGLSNSVLKREWTVFRVLNALKLMGNEAGAHHSSLKELQPFIERIEKWASLGPLLKPYLALVYAEAERALGEFRKARSLYLDAISTAHEQGYTFLEGYLNECLGELLLKAGGHSQRLFFAEAARLYRKCRAERKEIDLIERYPELFEEEKDAPVLFEAEPAPASTLPDLDVDYLMKSSLAISAEIELDALLKKIMDVVIESSGAQHGYLFIEEAGDLLVRAESHVTGRPLARALNLKLDDTENVCKAIVRYVYRTAETLILNDASREGIFKDNPEAQSMRLRAVLCLPVIKQSRLIGILYLENRLSDSVFTSGKIQMTELLTSQAAISLENAALLKKHEQAEERSKRSLREKEVLLKEIHHRVKNNLQIIHSMLNLQLRHIRDELAIDLFKESQNRIYSMALIHEKLYQSESLARIDLAEYVRSLAKNLFLSYGVSERAIELKIKIDSIAFDINTIIPCALIINELVSNSLKHAFPRSWLRTDDKGEICIELRQENGDGYVLLVSDNGAGLPEGFEIQGCRSLGLEIVGVLVRQLRGVMHLDTSDGTRFMVTFDAIKQQQA